MLTWHFFISLLRFAEEEELQALLTKYYEEEWEPIKEHWSFAWPKCDLGNRCNNFCERHFGVLKHWFLSCKENNRLDMLDYTISTSDIFFKARPICRLDLLFCILVKDVINYYIHMAVRKRANRIPNRYLFS